jgi:hypothetical protein
MGRVLPARDAAAWVEGLAEMLRRLPPPEERLVIARQAGGERQWAAAFAKFWADGLA